MLTSKISQSLFIPGTDTGVGKTVVTACLAALAQSLGLSVCVYKPVQTGATNLEQPDDPVQINRWLANPVDYYCDYIFTEPVAPQVADQHHTIDPKQFAKTCQSLKQRYDMVLVEGAGGIRVPITTNFDTCDLIRLLDIPALVVARPDLGTINHTRLTVETLQSQGIKTLGIIVSGYPEETTDLAIQTLPSVFDQWLSVPVLAWLPKFPVEDSNFKFRPDHLDTLEGLSHLLTPEHAARAPIS